MRKKLFETKPLAMGPLLEELLILVKEIVSIDKTMIFIGLIDVTSSVEKNITEFIMFAADATHLITPLNFFAHITKLAIEKQIPFIYVPKKEDLSQACCTVDEVSVIALKKSASLFATKIKHVKCLIKTMED